MKKIDSYIRILLKLLNSSDSSLVVSVQNSTGFNNDKKLLYPLPIRSFEKYIFAGLCNSDTEGAIYFINKIQEKSKYILLDVEKKFNSKETLNKQKTSCYEIEEVIAEIADKNKIIYMWPNSITVEACLASLINKVKSLASLKIGIIGIGNIGFKLALRLIEAGCNTSIFSRDYASTLFCENAINKIKPKSTLASPKLFSSAFELVENQDFLIICTSESFIFSENMSRKLSPGTVIISLNQIKISPKVDEIMKLKNIIIEIIDIDMLYLIEVFKKELSLKTPKPCRKNVKGLWICSNGFPAKNNDFVVDNAINPKIVLGQIDNNGNFCRKISSWEDINNSLD